MNKVILSGRLTANPEMRRAGETLVANYALAVDRRFRRDSEQSVDFLRCVAFGKGAEFAEKYLTKGMKIIVCGRIQTGSYTNRDGQKVYATDIVVEEHEFAESKRDNTGNTGNTGKERQGDTGFMDIPPDAEDDLPFD